MARSAVDRAGRTLIVFFAVLAVLYGLVALAGSWTPALGLDLQGGTRITLIAKDGNNTSATLEEARRIIDQRVNGSGVSEAEVTTQGNRFIVVEIPGESRRDLVETVKRQAQLRFRVVAQSSDGSAQPIQPSGSAESSGLPSEPLVTVAPSPTASPKGTKTPKSTETASPKNRAPFVADQQGGSTASPSSTPSGEETSLPAEEASETPTDGASPTESPAAEGGQADLEDPLQWMLNPDEESLAAFNAYTCPPAGQAPEVDDDADKPLVTCDKFGVKYLLSVAMIEGSELKSAALRAPTQQSVEYAVTLQFNGPGSDEFGRISDALFGTDRQFAIVLDGEVISAPTMNAPIHNGQAEITGGFTEAEARSLTTSLKFGALPIQFQADPPVETVGPSLAGNQLSAGITAGLLGLMLVMIYCLLYYRGLGLVVLTSLVVAAAMTYALVLLLSETAGFTLSLPGIAGLIVAVGITADSFVVYFERIRDEMRDGKSMRVAVETGWARARNTCLAADTVSLLAAVVLYIFAAGVVKGFAFALGLSTLIDLVVFFWFTHPMMTLLARYKFFNSGHRLSGLSAETLGIDKLPSQPAGRVTVGGEDLMGKFSRLGNDLYEGRVSVDFVGRKWLWYSVSLVLLGISLFGLTVQKLDAGIEFTGGAEFRVSLPSDQVTQDTADQLREDVAATGIDAAASPVVTTSGTEAILIQTEPLDETESETVVDAILTSAGVSQDDLSQSELGASWGREIAERSITGLAVFLVLVVLFIWAYFREWKMSVAALVALVHDVVITSGIYALSGFEVTPATVTGLLTILGFSLYDTVVVFDKVRENTKNLRRTRQTYAEAANLAVNQTLVRSINTSIVALIPVGAILYVGVFQLGSGSLKDLALALFVGMAVGAYSSIFIATPFLVQLKSTEKGVQEIERRALTKRRHSVAKADRYAAVPAYRDDLPPPDADDDLDDESDPTALRRPPVPTGRAKPDTRPDPAGRGRVVPPAHGPVKKSASAGRVQPTRQSRSKRGKK